MGSLVTLTILTFCDMIPFFSSLLLTRMELGASFLLLQPGLRAFGDFRFWLLTAFPFCFVSFTWALDSGVLFCCALRSVALLPCSVVQHSVALDGIAWRGMA